MTPTAFIGVSVSKSARTRTAHPKYGRVWKRRIFDAESGSYKWVDDDPRKYHPGRGVYRSSYRNAQRLARTETNIAYRTADYERWQQMPFVIGIEIKLSNNHPEPDICDDLKGIYPKTFKWSGWHPNCRCYQEPVLASPNELDKMLDNILDGKDTAGVDCANEVTAEPPTFKAWRLLLRLITWIRSMRSFHNSKRLMMLAMLTRLLDYWARLKRLLRNTRTSF